MLIAEKHERDLILAEATAQMLLEALDSKDLADATKVLKKLNAIAKVSPPVLAAAIKEAADEVNEFTGGGLGALAKKATTWLAKKFGAKAGTNPILKALTLLNSLELGLTNAVDLISNNAPDYDGNSDESLMNQVDETGAKNLRKNLAKAFQPGGVFAKIKSLFGSTGGIPYIKNVDKMVEEIMLMPAKKITTLINAAATGESSEAAAEAAKDMAVAGKKGDKGDQNTPSVKSGEPVKSTEDLATAVAKGLSQEKGDATGAKATAAAQENPKKFVKDFVDSIAKKSNQQSDVVEKVLNALIKKGKLKSDFKVAEGVVRSKKVTRLTMSDVLDAQMAILKCEGSTKLWVKYLFEADMPDNIKRVLSKDDDGREFVKKIEKGEVPEDAEVEVIKNTVKNSNLTKNVNNFNDELDKFIDNFKSTNKSGEEFKKKVEAATSIEDVIDILDEMDTDGKKKIGDMSVSLIVQILDLVIKYVKADKKKEAGRELKKLPEEIKFVKLKVRDLILKPKETSGGKYDSTIKVIQDDLKDVEPKSIEAILDAIPDFLKAESKKYSRVI